MIKVKLENFVDLDLIKLNKYEERIKEFHDVIHNKVKFSDYLGWVDLPNNYSQEDLVRMKIKANFFRSNIDVLIVIGIGGSYLGAHAAIDMINGLYKDNGVEIIYVGNTLSSTYTKQILEYVKRKEFGICMISKSGSTIEPMVAFSLFHEYLINKYGKERARERLVIITDKYHGILKQISVKEKYDTFIIPNDIGGRYSVLTPVGIFVMLVAGVNVDEVFEGARLAYRDTQSGNLNNEAYRYAVVRYILYNDYNYCSEMLVSYEIQFGMFLEWWKQLFGESEGKNNKGLLPISCVFTTDLHSLGQFIQNGTKNIFFETIIKVIKPESDLFLLKNLDVDVLNCLNGRTLHEINTIVFESVLDAHSKTAGIPVVVLEFLQMDSKMFGYLSYWFMKACVMSSFLLGVNPFDQPGVDIYKRRLLELLIKK